MGTGKLMYEWKNIPWRKLEVKVFKLQKRIYRASERGDVKTVRKLQRLLIKSRTAKLLAVRTVTQDNPGKRRAGIDGQKNLNQRDRIELAKDLSLPNKAQPIKRVMIPQPGKKEMRPLGIPTIRDRAAQALAKLALEPEWENKFGPHTYGFRPGRSAQDAVQYLFLSIRTQDQYILNADIKKCFSRINYKAFLEKLNTFPRMRRAIKAWLKSGVMENGGLFPTTQRISQGGVISPLLVNIALHGLENYITSRFPPRKRLGNTKLALWQPIVVRYADDLIILHRDLKELEKAKSLTEKWLENMGLEFSQEKTRIAHTYHEHNGEKPGFEFLGFSFNQYKFGKKDRRTVVEAHDSRLRKSKTLIRPTEEAIKRQKAKLTQVIDNLKTATQEKLILALNPLITGWSRYYSTVHSKEIFGELDYWLFIKLKRWAIRRHPMKGLHWIMGKYWGVDRIGKWDFTDDNFTLNYHRNTPTKIDIYENFQTVHGYCYD